MGFIAETIALYPGGFSAFKKLSGKDRNAFLQLKNPGRTPGSIRANLSKFMHKNVTGGDTKKKKVTKKTPKVTQPSSNDQPDDGASPAGGPSGNDPVKQAKQFMLNNLNGKYGQKSAEYILEHQHLFTEEKTIIRYNRPTQELKLDEKGNPIYTEKGDKIIIRLGLNPKQEELVNCITDQQTLVILIEGDRRTGKSTSWFYGMLESMVDGTRKKWGLWAATEQTCIKLHRDAIMDKNFYRYHDHLIMSSTAKRTRFVMDDCYVETHATKMSDASGLQYEGIVIDEFHQVLKDNAEAFATIMGITRSEPNLKVVLVCNKGEGVYEAFKDDLKPLIDKGLAKFFTLERDDVAHVTEEANLISSVLMEAAMGAEWRDKQLKNESSYIGQPFPPNMVLEAMHSYDPFIESLGAMEVFVCIGVDPGFAHSTGVIAMGAYRGHVFELESAEHKGKDTSDERIKAIVAEMADDYGATIVCESNSGGLHWMSAWSKLGHNTIAQNFNTNPEHPFNRVSMLKTIRDLFIQHRMHFCSKKLKTQLLKYNPDKDKNDSKGDLADAFIHASYYLITNYLSQEGQKVVFT